MQGMEPAFILHLPPQAARLALGPPHDPYGDGYIRSFTVELTDDGLSATTSATNAAHDLTELSAFLQTLADDWRGWGGTRTWQSMEGELRLDASHDGKRLVTLRITVGPRTTYGSAPWSASAVFHVEPGEQMQTIASQLAVMLASPPPG
jgi:hypothetical protein